MDRVTLAVDCFAEGFTCSQAILAAYGADFGLDRDHALKLADGFGGGMANRGEACGAVTGAFMVIGLKYGRTSAADREAKLQTRERMHAFVDRFEARNGSIACRDLLGLDLRDPQQSRIAREQRLFTTVCPEMVRAAAEILNEIL